MKRIGFLLLVLCASIVSVAGAQQSATEPPVGKNWHLGHLMANRIPTPSDVTGSQSLNVQANPDDPAKVWELGTYPGGTWFTTWHINDLGVIVGLGDVPPIGSDGVGYTHTLVVPLFGPNAGEWIDLGTLGGEQPKGWEEPFDDVSNTGLVVSHSTGTNGLPRAVAWTKETGMVDLGTLADTGNPTYTDYKASNAIGTNKLGTLIVGNSGVGPTGEHPGVPVVWTSSKVWVNGKFVTKWKIQELDTAAFPGFSWTAWSVNDFGQIIGVGGNDGETILVAALWNPRADGKGWEQLMSLSPCQDYPSPDPYGINEKGEIVGGVTLPDQSMWLSVLWKPLDSKRTKYSPAIVLPVPKGGFTSCEGVGINDLGDMVGDCWSNRKDLPTRWTTKDLTLAEIIKFPGTWGFSWGVNNNGIAAVTYGGGTNCPGHTYGSCGGAVQLH